MTRWIEPVSETQQDRSENLNIESARDRKIVQVGLSILPSIKESQTRFVQINEMPQRDSRSFFCATDYANNL